MFAKVDLNKDGKISFEEFCISMSNVPTKEPSKPKAGYRRDMLRPRR
jgi:hypothetical protein